MTSIRDPTCVFAATLIVLGMSWPNRVFGYLLSTDATLLLLALGWAHEVDPDDDALPRLPAETPAEGA